MLMDEDQWMYYSIMSEEVDMDDENEHESGMNEQYVDCSDAFNTSQLARSISHENEFVAMIMRSGQYRSRKKDFVRRDTRSRKYGCPFKFRGKPVVGGLDWMVKLMCGSHNHELAKSLVGHPYAGRLTMDEKTIIEDMAKSMVKPRNIMLTLKEHNVNSCTTIKQIYNVRNAYRSSIRESDTEMQHPMKLLERDQYIHWHRLKDEDVVRDIFRCRPNVMKLCNACNLVVLIDSTYKTNRYRLPLLDFVGVTPTGMTFFAGFAYLEGEHVNNVGRENANTVFILVRQSLLPTSSPQETRLGVPLSHKSFTPSKTHKDNHFFAILETYIGLKVNSGNGTNSGKAIPKEFELTISPSLHSSLNHQSNLINPDNSAVVAEQVFEKTKAKFPLYC
ncbi:Protein FAR1-RELATED SEQUENCE 5 [Glycine soja]